MALNLAGMSQEEINDQYAAQAASEKHFQDNIGDPAFAKAYQDSLDRGMQINQQLESQNSGGFFGLFDKILSPIMETVIKYGPAVYLAAVGGEAATGLFGDAGAAAAGGGGDALGASLGDVAGGLGSMPIDTAALGTGAADFAGLGGGGVGAAGAGAGGLGAIAAGGSGAAPAGSMIGVEGGAPAVVSVGAPAATAGGVAPAALGAGLGAGAILGANPTLPINAPALQNPGPVTEGGTHIPDSSLPPLVTPPLASNPAITNVNPVADGAANLPIVPPAQVPTGSGAPPGSTPPPGGGLPSSIPDWLKGILPLLGGNVDRIKAQQDSDWWKSQLDTLQGMYKPGTPEATQMEDKMNAMDAATGRNSQYGVRAVNLASSLADKRSGIMTSAGYQNMANAYRGRSSQDLNGLFSALGNSNTQNLLGSLGGTISNLFAPSTQ